MSYMDQRVSSSTHRSSKRDYGNDSEGSDEYETVTYPLSKRSRESSSIDFGMNQPAVTKIFFPIPDNCVGLVIGKNGLEIQNLSSKSGCRMVVEQEKNATGYRMVEIDGTLENIEKAKVLINEVVARGNLRPPMALMSNPTQPQLSQDQSKHVVEIWIPASKCGAIIGKGGETMKKLRAWSNCHIQLIQNSNEVTDEPKPLRVTGTQAAIDTCRKMVNDILQNADETPAHMVGNGAVANVSVQVKVPRTVVGAIMGLQGKNIRRLSEETGTKIQFMQDDDAKLVDRTLVIIGNSNKVFIAAQLIKDIVEANNSTTNVPVALFYLSIPSSKCGLVIGRGGETIKQINAESGAHCELSRDPNVHPHEKVFVIRGNEMQVEHAKHLICQRVGDIPANAPFKSYSKRETQASMTSPFDGHPIIQGPPMPHPAVTHPSQHPSQHPGVPQQWDGHPQMQSHHPQQAQFPPTAAVDWQHVQAQRAQQMGQFSQNVTTAAPTVQQLYHMQQQHLQHQHLQQQHMQQHMQQQQMHIQQIHQQLQNVPAPVSVQHPSSYAQKFTPPQSAPQVQQQPQPKQQVTPQPAQPTQAAAVPARVEADTSKPEEEEEPDFSAQWLEYYLSIGNTEAAEGVRRRIEELKEEKAQKEAAAAAATPNDPKPLSAGQNQRSDGYY